MSLKETYKIQFQTGDHLSGGTNARVHIELVGTKNSSGKLVFPQESKHFQRGKSDTFTIQSVDVGNINSIVVGHDNSGLGPGWFLDQVVITGDVDNHSNTWVFPCYKWFALDEDDKLIERKIIAEHEVKSLLSPDEGGDYENIYKEIWGEEKWKKGLEVQFSNYMMNTAQSKLQLKLYGDVIMAALIASNVRKGLRGTHPNGVGAVGIATVNPRLDIPKNSLFIPGKAFDVRVRHSNAAEKDDRNSDSRGCAIKFSNHPDESPLDLVLNTGRISGFWDLYTFLQVAKLRVNRDKPATEYEVFPKVFQGTISSLRLSPSTYAHLHYYSGIVYHFQADNGDKYYAKFRAIPSDPKVKEDGFLDTPELQRQACDPVKLPNDNRSPNYLREEFMNRLLSNPDGVRYTLQIQLKPRNSTDSKEVYHACNIWSEPYVDLAYIHLTSFLPDEDTEKTCFNIGNVPSPLLSFPEDVYSVYDLNSLSYTRRKVYKLLQPIRLSVRNHNALHYVVKVKTSGECFSKTHGGEIECTLVGSKGQTNFVLSSPLSSFGSKIFSPKFSVQTEEIGELIALIIELRKSFGTTQKDWYIEYVEIKNPTVKDVSGIFPFYRWILPNQPTQVLEAKATIPSLDSNNAVGALRKAIVERQRSVFKWDGASEGPGVGPAYFTEPDYAEIIFDEHFSFDKFRDTLLQNIHDTVNKTLTQHEVPYFKNFEDVKNLFGQFKKNPVAVSETWMLDTEFGYQFLNGCHPLMVQRINLLPSNFPVTDLIVQKSLRPNTTLASELAAGRIYIADYKLLEDIPVHIHEDVMRYCYPAMVLFYVNAKDEFVPIAIQCGQTPGPETHIFTPHEDQYDWLLAKMHLKSADGQVHQISSYLLKTQILIESIYIGLQQHVAPKHPVFKLLITHLKSSTSIKNLSRHFFKDKGIIDVVLAMSGPSKDKLLFKAFLSTSWSQLVLPKDLKNRGVEDSDKLPNYYYRDDGLLLWKAISNLVSGIIHHYYKNEEQIKNDNELQNFITEVYNNGLKKMHDFPSSFSGYPDLIEFLTTIIWTGSCLYSLLNYSQYEYFGWVPNYPLSVLKPVPHVKGQTTPETLVAALPNVKMAALQLITAWTLSQNSKEDIPFGQYPEKYICDPEALYLIATFQDDLKHISDEIHSRNTKRKQKYLWLLPEKIIN